MGLPLTGAMDLLPSEADVEGIGGVPATGQFDTKLRRWHGGQLPGSLAEVGVFRSSDLPWEERGTENTHQPRGSVRPLPISACGSALTLTPRQAPCLLSALGHLPISPVVPSRSHSRFSKCQLLWSLLLSPGEVTPTQAPLCDARNPMLAGPWPTRMKSPCPTLPCSRCGQGEM